MSEPAPDPPRRRQRPDRRPLLPVVFDDSMARCAAVIACAGWGLYAATAATRCLLHSAPLLAAVHGAVSVLFLWAAWRTGPGRIRP